MSVTIRMAKKEDAAALLAIYAPYVTDTNITFEYTIPTVEEFESRITATLTRYPYLVAEEDGRLLGYAYVSAFKSRAAYAWSVETSIYIDQNQRGRGVGQVLYNQLEEILHRQNILNLCACITYPNPASEQFHQRCGYRKTAHIEHCGYKMGEWIDIIWMQKELSPLPKDPLPVIPITELYAEIK